MMSVSQRKGVYIPRRAVFVRKRKHSSRERFEPGYITKEKQKMKMEKDNITNLRKALNKCGSRKPCSLKAIKKSRICRHELTTVYSASGTSLRVYLLNGGYMHLENDHWLYHKKND
ncbi:MAG: hypothetical protein QXZ44_02990 [Ferroplasma sp.]